MRSWSKMIPTKKHTAIRIEGRAVGDGEPCFIIAEAGVNHNGDLRLARKLIDAAKKSGADAVKFQTFKASSLVTPDTRKADYQKKNDPGSSTQLEMLKKLELTDNDFEKLSAYAKRKGIIFLSTAFDDASLELLIRLGVPAFKIPSGEITNIPFLEKIALLKKPVILSTGMATMDEVTTAVGHLRRNGCTDIILLHCTTSYPAPPESVNLNVMDTLREAFGLSVGYSDHTEGCFVPVAAVAKGACVIEKHFTLDRNLSGPDHAASVEPVELQLMIESIRQVERILGSGIKKPDPCEMNNRDIVRKSIIAAEKIPKGSILRESMLVLKRPGTGIEPRFLNDLVGKPVKKTIAKDTIITWDMIG